MGDFFIQTATLEGIARSVLLGYDRGYLNRDPQAVPLERIIEDVLGLSIDYMRLTIAADELGRMIYDNGYTTRFNPDKDDYELVRVQAGTILIESLLVGDTKQYGRYRYTLAHELGHWLLHKQIYTGTGTAAATFGTDKADNAVEWQADYIAKAILMPVGQVKRGFYKLRSDNSRIAKLASLFEVSKQAMEIRLNELGLIC